MPRPAISTAAVRHPQFGPPAVDRRRRPPGSARYPGEVQLGLFEPPPERAEAVARLKRAVNARVGRFALRSAATLYLNDLYRDEASSYDVCDIRGKLCF